MTITAGPSPFIRLRNVGKDYETSAGITRALVDFSAEMATGELVGIVGKSGSGKSTLLNLLTGIDRASRGEMLVAGAALHDLPEGRLAAWRGRHVGVVFQFFQLLPTLTIVENVMLPMDFCDVFPAHERLKRALALLERVGIVDQANKLPFALSGGQQQRAAIARALANDPQLIVADEPTGNLDSHTGRAVWQLFADLAAAGKTVVVVTHDAEVSGWVNRVISLADGAIISDRTTPTSTQTATFHA